MTAESSQLELFARSESRSSSDVPSLHRSSARTTSSNDPSMSALTSATGGGRTRRARGASAVGGARAAGRSSASAKDTAESERPVTLSEFTSPNTVDPMFEIPRPRTRADCLQEARPCPWVGCRHHLLLEVATQRAGASTKRAPSLRLNRASSNKTIDGRRPGLRSSAAAALVQTWIDEAVEMLSYMPYTCSLDVVDDHADGLSARRVGWLFAVTEQMIDKESRKPHAIDVLARLKEFMLR